MSASPEVKYKIQSCPKCRADVAASHKFCPACGRRLGFGIRSEGEIRKAIKEIDSAVFTVSDISLRGVIVSDCSLISYVLEWVLGEKDMSPLEKMVQLLTTASKVRRDDGK